MQYPRAIAVLTVLLCCLGAAAAQIVSIQEIDGKTVACTRSGLSSDLAYCDARSSWYAYVFIGSISAITSIEDDEKQIQITPEEIFHGEPANPLVVQTSQGACLPKLAVGDRWLFFLRTEDGKPIVLGYGGDSRPMANAQTEIETLRRLQTIGDFGIVRGRVLQGSRFEGEPRPGVLVVAHRASDKMQFIAKTDADGRYEFDLLPAGKYDFTVDATAPFRPEDAWLEVPAGACRDLTITKERKAQLGGHVKRSDGSPVSGVDVLIMTEDEEWFTTEKSDERGYFYDDSLRPGKYVVGINLPGAPPWKYSGGGGAGLDVPMASLYYPGMQKRSKALVITLTTDEKRDDIDFIVPK